MKFLDFLFAARPMLLLPVWSILIISHYLTDHELLAIDFLILFFAHTFIFAGAYYINQIFDYETDKINNKLGFLQKGIISIREMTIVFILVSIIAVLLGFFYSVQAGIIILTIFVLGLLYSVPPFKLKDNPVGGLLINSLSYGFLIPLSTCSISGLKAFDLELILIIYFICTVSAVYLLTIIPDKEGDIASGKKTLAAYMSNNVLIIIGIAFLLISCLAAFLGDKTIFLSISVISIIILITTLSMKNDKSILFACKLPILLLNILAGYYFWPYFIFLFSILIITRVYYKKRFDLSYPRIN